MPQIEEMGMFDDNKIETTPVKKNLDLEVEPYQQHFSAEVPHEEANEDGFGEFPQETGDEFENIAKDDEAFGEFPQNEDDTKQSVDENEDDFGDFTEH